MTIDTIKNFDNYVIVNTTLFGIPLEKITTRGEVELTSRIKAAGKRLAHECLLVEVELSCLQASDTDIESYYVERIYSQKFIWTFRKVK